MSMPARLSIVTIGARDLPVLRRFYGALGWNDVDGSDDDWSAYLVGGALLALYPLSDRVGGQRPLRRPRSTHRLRIASAAAARHRERDPIDSGDRIWTC